MPKTFLFATNSEGRIYALSTYNAVWREFVYLGLEFKKISAVQNFMWAIGGDRQAYVYVHGFDIPVRVREESYENQRWIPIEGFSTTRMLPTDRFKFSSKDGTVNREISKIRLPSMAWQWEGDWQLELSLDGEPLDHDGWTYAVDFPMKYYAKKSWNSCVRRRKWFRYRKYSAMNSWCAVAPLHKDPTQEPFVDIAIGGHQIPDATAGIFCVWAITAHGRVMFRTGVTLFSPEGARWTAISLNTGHEISQISIGPSGLVWAVLYNGKAIVRTGVKRNTLTGENWVEVNPPSDELRILQLSVGTNSVWCVTNNNRVWFRRGIKGSISGISEEAATGKEWIEMVGNISAVSVAPNDLVFGVGASDRALYFRMGITENDLTGTRWCQIQCPVHVTRTSSTPSLSSQGSSFDISLQKQLNANNEFEDKARVETPALPSDIDESYSSAYDDRNADTLPARSLNERTHNRRRMYENITEHGPASAPIMGEKQFETQLRNPRAWSPVRSVGSVVATEAHPETDSAVFESDSNSSLFFGDDEDQCDSLYWAQCDMSWTSCCAAGVVVDPNHLPKWFNEAALIDSAIDLSQKWRLDLLNNLKSRFSKLEIDQEKYEVAVKLTSWVKNGKAKIVKHTNALVACLLELEWISSSNSITGSGTLTVLNEDGVTIQQQCSLSEISIVSCCSEPGSPRLALYAPRLSSAYAPLKLQFPTDSELEDWLSQLSYVCNQINDVSGRPSNDSIWITNALGDVFVYDQSNHQRNQFEEESKLYVQENDFSAQETPYYNKLYNGLPVGSTLEITGCIYDDADHVRFDLQCHSTVKQRLKLEKLRHVALHINPRFNENTIVLNSMENSDWKDEQRLDIRKYFQPGMEFKILVKCQMNGFQILVNDIPLPLFRHRTFPEAISELYVSGRVKLFKLTYKSVSTIIPVRDMFWRQIGGHLRKVKTSQCGIAWGIGYDNTAWAYTGGWGGTFMKGLDSSSSGVYPMTDIHTYYIYENQRWNPLSGYTDHGLPTDRNMWSDATGKQKRSKEQTKLMSMHWQWISDWIVDFHVPGGSDKDGWQYAIDFPASYHAKKQFTDYVRRRRWYRKCRLIVSGPWQEIGNTKIVDVSLQPQIDGKIINVWAIAANGDALMRRTVTSDTPVGTAWDHITTQEPLVAVACGRDNAVWAITKNGSALRRNGVTNENPQGVSWTTIEQPKGTILKQISIGELGVWAIDSTGQTIVRREVCKKIPQGSGWEVLTNVLNDPPHEEAKIGFRSVSVGSNVWAVSNSGFVCKRCGITSTNPAGTGWILGLKANFDYISGI